MIYIFIYILCIFISSTTFNDVRDIKGGQLKKLNAAVKGKRPELVNRKGVIFHDDNATPHTFLATHQKLSHLVQYFAD